MKSTKTILTILFVCTVFGLGCKKDAPIVQKQKPTSEAELTKINYNDFKKSVNLNNLGFLKQKFVSTDHAERIMSIGTAGILSDLSIYTDTIQKIVYKSGISYVFMMPSTSPHATSFRNLTIEVNGNKTNAFIATYSPTAKWIKAKKENRPIAFDGNISIAAVNLESTNIKDALASAKSVPGERLMSINKKIMTVDICTTYIIWTYTAYGCSQGDHLPGDPNCWTSYDNVPPGEYMGGYTATSTPLTICETVVSDYTAPTSGGGGGSTPTPPPGYNPCNGDLPNISFKFERGTRLAVLPPTPCDPPIMPEGSDPTINSNSQYLINVLGIGDQPRRQYLINHTMAANDMVAYLAENGSSEEKKDFLRWGIGSLAANPNTTNFEIFRNQFLGKSEGQDGDFSEAYWNDPNLSFPPQQLPSFQAYDSAFPKKNGGYMPATEVYQLVGGQLYNSHLSNPNNYANACAVRVSRALNYSGILIPFISGQTEKGADNKNYFKAAANLNEWMKKTFSVYTTFTGAQGGKNGRNFPSLLQGKKGIYIMIPTYPAYFASGHADVWDGTDCNGGCYFNIEKDLPLNRKLKVAYINLWELN